MRGNVVVCPAIAQRLLPPRVVRDGVQRAQKRVLRKHDPTHLALQFGRECQFLRLPVSLQRAPDIVCVLSVVPAAPQEVGHPQVVLRAHRHDVVEHRQVRFVEPQRRIDHGVVGLEQHLPQVLPRPSLPLFNVRRVGSTRVVPLPHVDDELRRKDTRQDEARPPRRHIAGHVRDEVLHRPVAVRHRPVPIALRK